MQENIWVQIFWVVCVATAIVASVLVIWRRSARNAGAASVSATTAAPAGVSRDEETSRKG